jgi:phage terminase large subunit-like protein
MVFEDGEPLWLGVDIGGERSSSALVWLNERLQVGCAIYGGESGILDILARIRELAARYQVVELTADPWRFGQAAQELASEGMTVSSFPQSMERMIPASQRLHEAITNRRLVLPANEELTRQAANTIARHSQRGWRIDKPTKETKIDAIVALAMCLDRAENRPEPARLVGWL